MSGVMKIRYICGRRLTKLWEWLARGMPEADVIISFVFLEDCLASQRSVPCRPDLQRAKDGRPQGRPSPSPAPEGGVPGSGSNSRKSGFEILSFHMVRLLPDHLVCAED